MISTKTTAMVIALAAIGVLGALATVGNQAVFAQATNTNTNTQAQTGINLCTATGGSLAIVICPLNQEMGNCQVGIAANDGSDVNSNFESGDCS
jgi:hypothetical protein